MKFEYKMQEIGFYGVAIVFKETFDKLNDKYFISCSTDTVKYMCANDDQKEHLESLGIDTGGVVCDWFKILVLGKETK